MNELLRRLLFLPPQASTLAREIDGLHYVVILSTFFGAGLVTLAGGYFLLRYKRRGRIVPGAAAEPSADYRPAATLSLPAEVSVIGVLLTLFVAFWYVGFRQYVRIRIAPEDAMRVYVTGKKWMWSFAYPDGRGSVGTLYVPAARPIELLLTSRDVIHSFFVPAFRIKQDAVPGRFTTAWFEAPRPGVYQVLCAEYCGTGHSTMRGQVVVLDAADYDRWSSDRPGAPVAGSATQEGEEPGLYPGEGVSLLQIGQRAAVIHGCLRCHSIDGTPHIGPTWAGMYRAEVPLASGATVVADEAYLTRSMSDPAAQLHAGFEPLMPTYQGILQPAETAGLLEYIKALRDVPVEPQQPSFRSRAPGAGGAPR